VRRREGAAPIITGTTRVGTVKPLGVGAGCLALLMAMDPGEAEEIVVRNEAARMRAYPGFTAERLRGLLGHARALGYSLDDEGITPGVRAIGLPVRDSRGRLLASLSCTVFAERLPPSRQPVIAALLRDAAAEITRRLGAAGDEGT
jgi:DNA-binding IclR family transcriptional regulator